MELLKEIFRSGYLDRWPGGGDEFISLVRGVNHLRTGAIWAGIGDMLQISGWNPVAVEIIAAYVPGEIILNAVAEIYHNAFKRDKRLLLILSAVLGPLAMTAPDYFATVLRFFTRVVGLRYGSCESELDELRAGMPVYLVREPENKYDCDAVAVLSPWGARLGYLRAPLAATISARCAGGEAFAARVAAVLGPAHDLNERLHIEVWRDEHPGKACFAYEKAGNYRVFTNVCNHSPVIHLY
ncbi:MAG: HIRAN domain-containing protein [Bacillota bacterium]